MDEHERWLGVEERSGFARLASLGRRLIKRSAAEPDLAQLRERNA
jgi:hypothetical protein